MANHKGDRKTNISKWPAQPGCIFFCFFNKGDFFFLSVNMYENLSRIEFVDIARSPCSDGRKRNLKITPHLPGHISASLFLYLCVDILYALQY